MKKIVLTLAALVFVGVAGGMGLLNATFQPDDLSEQDYQISLEEAISIFEEEAHSQKVTSIGFFLPDEVKKTASSAYSYLFVDKEHEVVVNPTTGKTTTKVISQQKKQNQTQLKTKKLRKAKKPQVAMKEAIAVSGNKRAKVHAWEILEKEGKLYYNIHLLAEKKIQQFLISA